MTETERVFLLQLIWIVSKSKNHTDKEPKQWKKERTRRQEAKVDAWRVQVLPPTLYRSQGAMGLLCGTSEMAKSHWQKNHLPFKSLGVPKSTKRMRDALEKRPTVNVPNFENIYIDRQVNRLVAPNQQDVGQRFVATQSMILAANLTKLLWSHPPPLPNCPSLARLQHVDGWMRGMPAADFANTVATQQLLKRVQEVTNQAVI